MVVSRNKAKKNRKNLDNKMPNMKELMAFLNEQSGPVDKRKIAREFNIKGDMRRELNAMLRELKHKGLVEKFDSARKKGLRLAGKLNEYCQIEITGIDSMGDLIARPYEWQSSLPMPQIIVTKNKVNPPAGVGDVVQARVKETSKRFYEAEVLRHLTTGGNLMVGLYEKGVVLSVDRRLKQAFHLFDVPRDVKDEDIVLVEIPMVRSREPVAKFVKKIGSWLDPFAATLISIYQHHLPIMWMKQTEDSVQHLTVPSLDENRVDLRHIPFVTIDGADARDFDDAVWAEKSEEGYHVMIAIADVSWYVRSGTPLDSDAKLRGNSTYFPDRVLPMLPFELSNGVCSLRPNEDRASLVCEVWLDKNGVKLRHKFVRSLIRSVRRLTYEEVQDALDGRTPIVGLELEISTLNDVYLSLKKQRKKRGVIEIDVPEQQVVLNQKGEVVSVRSRESWPAHQLIEELMILANVSAAETLEEHHCSTIMYRVHDRPSLEKLNTLNLFLNSIGVHYKNNFSERSQPVDFNNILLKTSTSPKSFAIHEFVLRSQSQAYYSGENLGHFGLSLLRYAHFTSPIRRYADLMVHRALVSVLKLGEGGLSKDEVNVFDETARHISQTERQSASAEQDATDRYIASFLHKRVGQTFITHISSVTKFGLFVRISECGADGFIPIRYLTHDYFDFDEASQALVGRSTGKQYVVGDKVRAQLIEASPITGGLLLKIR